MAAKIYNITLPDGTTVPLPAWATDETLRRLVAETTASKKLDEKLLKVLSGIVHETGSIDDILRDLKTTTERETKKREILDKKTQRSVGRFTTAATKAAKGMGDTSKPLSTSLNMMQGAVETLFKDIDSSTSKTGKRMSRFSSKTIKMYSAFGKATGIAINTILGLNAKKFEQYEESQRRMIDAGAAFLDSEQSFHDLYKKAIKSGVSYDTFTQLVQQSGTVMLALGDSVSTGQVKFLTMFKSINDSANKFGDFGLQSADMMKEFADYVEQERLKGTIEDLNTEAGQKKLQDGFADLLFETTHLASLTGIKSKDQRAAIRRANESDPLYAVAKGKLTKEQRGSIDTATGIVGSLSDKNPLFKLFLDAQHAMVVNDLDAINATSHLTDMYKGDPVMQHIIKMMTTNKVMRGMQAALEGGEDILPVLNDFRQTLADTTGLNTGFMGANQFGTKLEEMASHAIQAGKQTRNLTKKALKEVGSTTGFDTSYTTGIGQKLGASGAIVSTMNTFGIMMAQLQEKVLLPLDKTAQSLYSISSAFRMFVEVALTSSVKNRFKEYKIPILASNDEVAGQLFRIQEIITRGYDKRDVKNVKKDGKWITDMEGAEQKYKTYAQIKQIEREGGELTAIQRNRLKDMQDAKNFGEQMNQVNIIDKKMSEGAEIEQQQDLEKNTALTNSTSQSSVTPNENGIPTHVKLITDHQDTTLQNHKSMLSLTEELKITVANMKQVITDRSNSTRPA